MDKQLIDFELEERLRKKELPDLLGKVSPEYLNYLLEQYLINPEQVGDIFRAFFDGVIAGMQDSSYKSKDLANASTGKEQADAPLSVNLHTEVKILDLIQAYRSRGHLKAKVNPLMQVQEDKSKLELKYFDLNSSQDNKQYEVAKKIGLKATSLKNIVEHLEKTYCGSIGVEYQHISSENVRSWLEEKMENSGNTSLFSSEEKKAFFSDVMKASTFENFLQKNFTGQKRFSLEGGEAIIAALSEINKRTETTEVQEINIAMAHRGRLNVLAHILGKPYESIFNEFAGANIGDDGQTSGDVKYHLGHSYDLKLGEKNLHISLAFNPSHLEAADPVLVGMARAKQEMRYQGNKNALLPIMIHGDAAVCGQGVVWETLNLSNLEGYQTGGTLHFIINNQIGFTTLPEDSRSTLYCTDFTKAISAPILHVNGDDIEALVHATRLAFDFRMKFNQDIFIDIICYRKYGHNEGDEPRFTQPSMYEKIGAHRPLLKKYSEQLSSQGVLNIEEAEAKTIGFERDLDSKLEKVSKQKMKAEVSTLKADWSNIKMAKEQDMLSSSDTSLKSDQFEKIVNALHKLPADIKPLSKLTSSFDKRYQKIVEEDEIDWAVAEQLAFGSLLMDGHSVRLSGQDCKRGTFGHRHSEIHDAKNDKTYMPLKSFESDKAKLHIINSPLSEYAVMGFDFGYSISNPMCLTLWEAQFGDFANGAQIIIDQFVCSSESKWLRMSGLVLLLPHGHEGQGPEHSSARLERFLQLCSRANMTVAYPTIPSQYFHLLRRQLKRDFRKPLIVMTPKGPLRRAEVVSKKSDFISGGFKNIILTNEENPKPKRVVFCSGKVYWDLMEYAKQVNEFANTLFVRIEQLYPLDLEFIKGIKKEFKSDDWLWVQEEPQNMGAYHYFYMQTKDLKLNLRFVGRSSSPSVATGSPNIHKKELELIFKETFK